MFYANDEGPAVDSRRGPDFELWIMDTDGGNLRQVTSSDDYEENAVWGLNDIDVVYSADDRTWEVAKVLTGEKLFGFYGVARGRYVSPVLAATGHVLIPTQAAIEEKKVDENGYVDEDWLKAQLGKEPGSTTASSSGGAQSHSGYRVAGIHYEIFAAFTQTPLYQSDIGGYFPR